MTRYTCQQLLSTICSFVLLHGHPIDVNNTRVCGDPLAPRAFPCLYWANQYGDDNHVVIMHLNTLISYNGYNECLNAIIFTHV